MLDAIRMTDMRIPANAIIHVEEMKGGVVLSVEVDAKLFIRWLMMKKQIVMLNYMIETIRGRAKYMKTLWDGHFFTKKMSI